MRLIEKPYNPIDIIIFIRGNVMDCVVIADFKCKEGMAAEMGNVFREALV